MIYYILDKIDNTYTHIPVLDFIAIDRQHQKSNIKTQIELIIKWLLKDVR